MKTNCPIQGSGIAAFVFLLCSLSGAFALAPHDDIPEMAQANRLIYYAATLAGKGEVVKVGKDGLTVNGPKLEGDWVRRPSDALARATEMYAEYAAEKKDIGIMADVIATWRALKENEMPIAYLRLFSKQNADNNFGKYCQAELAAAYLRTGDEESAVELLEKFKSMDASDQEAGYGKALLAQYYLSKGDFDSARAVAEDVVKSSQARFLHAGSGQGYLIAMAVVSQLPPSTKPEAAGSASAGGEEPMNAQKTLEKNLKDNPRLYAAMGNAALQKGDKMGAIQNWEEFKKRLPDDAEPVAMLIGKTYGEMRQYDKAYAAYISASVQYSNSRAGWEGIVKAAEMLQEMKKSPQAMELVVSSIPKMKSPDATAQLLQAAALYSLRNNKSKEAAAYYIELLSRYGDQDAAKNVLKDLEDNSKRVKDWRGFVGVIQPWLSGTGVKKQQVGSTTLNVADASRLRRMVLGLYYQNNEQRSGLHWLQSIMMAKDAKETEWLNRDMAWYLSKVATDALGKMNYSGITEQDRIDACKMGMQAWQFAPNTEEGLAGIKAAKGFIVADRMKRVNRDLEGTLTQMLQGPYKSDAKQLLFQYYEYLGDKRAIETLKAQDLINAPAVN